MRKAGVVPASPAIGAVLDAACAKPPTPEQRALWPRLSRMAWPNRRARRIAACIGRRGLKTSGILAWLAVHEALCGGHDEHALAGTRIYAVIVAPRQAQARESTRAVKAALDALAPLGVAYTERDSEGTPEIVITNPPGRCERVITIMTCDSVAVRGFAVFFLGADEAGFWPSEEWLAERDRDVVKAIRAGMAQFPNAREVFVSSPGRPGSYFHELVEKPSAGSLVVRAPSWVTNPRISEARCLADADGDLATFEREYAARRWGQAGESFLDQAKVWASLGSAHAGKGPRPGAFVCAFDHGQLRDDAAIVVGSGFDVSIRPDAAPVRHVVVEHAEAIPSSKASPLPTAALVARLVAVAAPFGEAPVVFDAHAAVDVKDELRKRGYREWEHPERVPPRRTFMQLSMAPQHQTPRWKAVRDLAHGSRLHLGAHDEPLAKELTGLSATMLSSGALKVEGRKDNQADALALLVPIALRLPATGGPGGRVEFRSAGIGFDRERGRVFARGGRWVAVGADGRESPAETPRWHPSFARYAAEMLATGNSTPAIEAWRREQRGDRD